MVQMEADLNRAVMVSVKRGGLGVSPAAAAVVIQERLGLVLDVDFSIRLSRVLLANALR
jgi:hypothetical protein